VVEFNTVYPRDNQLAINFRLQISEELIMNLTKGNKLAKAILLGLVLLVAMPALTFAQGRGRDRGRNKKTVKFVNGHDARDGRWDGRGPNRRNISHNRRWRNRDDDNRFRRNRRLDRDGDGDFDRRDVLLSRRLRRNTRSNR
jgi:hypothetical protein